VPAAHYSTPCTALPARLLGGVSRKGLAKDGVPPALGPPSCAQHASAETGRAEGEEEVEEEDDPQARQRLRRSYSVESEGQQTELTGAEGSGWASWWDGGAGSEGASLLGSAEFEGSGALLGLERRSALLGSRGGSGAMPPQQSEAAPAAAVATPQEAAERFGLRVRDVVPGGSFGERALLSRRWARAGTVVALGLGDSGGEQAVAEEEAYGGDGGGSAPPSAPGCVELLRIGRAAFDAAVRSLQAAALEELLACLAGTRALAGLPREHLTALAVLGRPREAAPGEVLAGQGEAVEGLLVVLEGELELLDGPAPGGSGGGDAGAGPGATARRLLAPGNRGRRATADQLPVRAFGAAPRSLLRGESIAAAPRGARRRTAGDVAGPALPGGGERGGSGVLAVVGPGALLGENALGEDAGTVRATLAVGRLGCACVPDFPSAAALSAMGLACLCAICAQDPRPLPRQDPYDAARAPGAAAPAFTPLHAATAVARVPCRLLLVATADLWRFGRRLRAPLAEAARARRVFVERRRALLRGTRSGLAAAAAQLQRRTAANRLAGGGGSGGTTADAFQVAEAAALGADAAAAGVAGALTPWDVRALRQLVPPAAPPSLLDIAAAGRPFPEALLTASAPAPRTPAGAPEAGDDGAPLEAGWAWSLGSLRPRAGQAAAGGSGASEAAEDGATAPSGSTTAGTMGPAGTNWGSSPASSPRPRQAPSQPMDWAAGPGCDGGSAAQATAAGAGDGCASGTPVVAWGPDDLQPPGGSAGPQAGEACPVAGAVPAAAQPAAAPAVAPSLPR
jgi:CRP-like cAMP-binding protein